MNLAPLWDIAWNSDVSAHGQAVFFCPSAGRTAGIKACRPCPQSFSPKARHGSAGLKAGQAEPAVGEKDPMRKDTREPRRTDGNLEADLVVIGAGFTGLAVAYHAARLLPKWKTIVLEADRVGAGASGRTGGVVLSGTAAGILPGTEKAVESLKSIISQAGIQCHLRLPGCYNVARRLSRAIVQSPIWNDSGRLCAVREEPGGDFDPSEYLSGLAHALEAKGVAIYEKSPVEAIVPGDPVKVISEPDTVLAGTVVLATNALSLGLMDQGRFLTAFNTFAIATEPVPRDRLGDGWWAKERAFYTLDLPYLWGRTTADGRIVIGSGIVACDDGWRVCPEGQRRCIELERRLRRLHPAFADLKASHGWWGPICFSSDSLPHIVSSPKAPNIYFVGGYCGHGAAVSALVAEVLVSHLAGNDAALKVMPWLMRRPRQWFWSKLKGLQAKLSLAVSRLKNR
jgi:glycine/D-amino acid oxidase-like deaminating enzyme